MFWVGSISGKGGVVGCRKGSCLVGFFYLGWGIVFWFSGW